VACCKLQVAQTPMEANGARRVKESEQNIHTNRAQNHRKRRSCNRRVARPAQSRSVYAIGRQQASGWLGGNYRMAVAMLVNTTNLCVFGRGETMLTSSPKVRVCVINYSANRICGSSCLCGAALISRPASQSLTTEQQQRQNNNNNKNSHPARSMPNDKGKLCPFSRSSIGPDRPRQS